MSTERHLPKKRTSITIDGEAEAASAPIISEEVMANDAAVEASVFGRGDNLEGTQSSSPNEVDPASATQSPATEPLKAGTSPGGSIASTVTGGVIGAVLALAGAYGLQTSGILSGQSTSSSTIESRLTAIETSFASGTNSEGEQLASLSAEVTALKDSVAALSQAAGNSSVADRVTALEQSASLATPQTNGADMTALASRIATLESKVTGSSSAEALTTMKNALVSEIGSLKADMASLKSEMAQRASEPGLAAAFAATALRSAVDRGGAFAAELENLANVAPDMAAVAALRSFAASGVPTRQELTTEFETAAAAMMAAAEPVDTNASLIDQLMASAKGLVKVRPIGALDGDTPAARIARIGEALAKSDDTAIATEFAALPASSRAAGAVFMERFKARSEADRLIAEAVRAASPKAGD